MEVLVQHPNTVLRLDVLLPRICWNDRKELEKLLYKFYLVQSFCSIFPKEIVPTPRRWAENRFPNIVYWNELDKGGHFAAFEQPDLFVAEMRSCFEVMSLS